MTSTTDSAETLAEALRAQHYHERGLPLGKRWERLTDDGKAHWLHKAQALIASGAVRPEVEVLRDAAVAVERLRQENPMNGDGSNHALDRVLGVLDRLAGDASPSDAAATERKRIAEQRERDYLRLEQENARRRVALTEEGGDRG